MIYVHIQAEQFKVDKSESNRYCCVREESKTTYTELKEPIWGLQATTQTVHLMSCHVYGNLKKEQLNVVIIQFESMLTIRILFSGNLNTLE